MNSIKKRLSSFWYTVVFVVVVYGFAVGVCSAAATNDLVCSVLFSSLMTSTGTMLRDGYGCTPFGTRFLVNAGNEYGYRLDSSGGTNVYVPQTVYMKEISSDFAYWRDPGQDAYLFNGVSKCIFGMVGSRLPAWPLDFVYPIIPTNSVEDFDDSHLIIARYLHFPNANTMVKFDNVIWNLYTMQSSTSYSYLRTTDMTMSVVVRSKPYPAYTFSDSAYNGPVYDADYSFGYSSSGIIDNGILEFSVFCNMWAGSAKIKNKANDVLNIKWDTKHISNMSVLPLTLRTRIHRVSHLLVYDYYTMKQFYDSGAWKRMSNLTFDGSGIVITGYTPLSISDPLRGDGGRGVSYGPDGKPNGVSGDGNGVSDDTAPYGRNPRESSPTPAEKVEYIDTTSTNDFPVVDKGSGNTGDVSSDLTVLKQIENNTRQTVQLLRDGITVEIPPITIPPIDIPPAITGFARDDTLQRVGDNISLSVATLDSNNYWGLYGIESAIYMVASENLGYHNELMDKIDEKMDFQIEEPAETPLTVQELNWSQIMDNDDGFFQLQTDVSGMKNTARLSEGQKTVWSDIGDVWEGINVSVSYSTAETPGSWISPILQELSLINPPLPNGVTSIRANSGGSGLSGFWYLPPLSVIEVNNLFAWYEPFRYPVWCFFAVMSQVMFIMLAMKLENWFIRMTDLAQKIYG